MKNLFIMRHAKSSWDSPELPDHDRPLNQRGKADAPRMGRWLRDYGVLPDRIISSTAKRARKTAKAVAKVLNLSDHLELDRELYFGTTAGWFESLRANGADAECIMLVGHNPGLEEFLEQVSGQYESLPTAAIAHVELPIQDWSQLDRNAGGRLVTVQRPRELR